MTVPAASFAEALLPNGLRDGLPPDADREAEAINTLMAVFAANAYQRVKPPLIEFETSLLAGTGQATADQTFRVMDPISQRMMGLRADMTPQVARIAATRLARMPRPLRLAYAGQVLRVRGSQLRPERQFAQAGIEVIGAGGVTATAEIILVTVEALGRLSLPRVTVDITCPPLVPALCRTLGLGAADTQALRRALEQKDLARVRDLAGDHAAPFLDLARAVGPLDRALAVLAPLSLPGAEAEAARRDLMALARQVQAEAPEVDVTLDPLEHRGFEYHSGCSFALFAPGARGELGRGGAYTSTLGERHAPCCGATLYLDSLLTVAPAAALSPRVLVPCDLSRDDRRRLQDDGWVTLSALDVPADDAEARRLGCDHVLGADGRPRAVALAAETAKAEAEAAGR